MSKSQSVIAKCPDCEEEFIYDGNAIRPRVTCPECKKRFYITIENDSKDNDSIDSNIKKTSSANPPIEQFIDDPVELLTSTCVRELNSDSPDSRWASILLTLLDKTNKLEYKDVEKAQLQNRLKAKSISELITSKKQLMKL